MNKAKELGKKKNIEMSKCFEVVRKKKKPETSPEEMIRFFRNQLKDKERRYGRNSEKFLSASCEYLFCLQFGD